MGKMKIQNNKKTDGGMPTWLLSLIIGLVALLVVGICIASFLSSTGVFDRMSTAMESEDYSISLPMMKYFYQDGYSSFVSNTTYSYLSSYCSLNNSLFGNGGLPLDQQKIVGANAGSTSQQCYDSILIDNITDYAGKTWHDYFMDQAIESANKVLIFCEVADDRNITLTAEEKNNVVLAAENLAEQIKATTNSNGEKIYAGLSDDQCFAAVFGNGVKAKDIEAALELISLAGKASSDLSDELFDAVTIDRIEAEYEENSKEYDLVDFATYGFSVKYDAIAKEVLEDIGADAKKEDHKDEILAAYIAEIEKAAAKAKELSAITDKDAFIKFVVDYYVEENYEESYDDLKESEEIADKDCPAEADETTIKNAMKDKILEELFAEDAKDTAIDDVDEVDGEETFTAYGVSVTKTYGDFITEFKSKFYSSLSSVKSNCVREEYRYSAPAEDAEADPEDEWLFDKDRVEKETTLIEDGDGADGAPVKVTDNNYTANVILMLAPRYREEDNVRDGAFMTFATKEEAMKAIEALDAKGSIDLDTFLEIAAEVNAGNFSELADYIEGSMDSDKFDEWFLDEKRVKGDYTAEPIEVNSSSYVVAYFEQVDDLTVWQVTVKSVLYNEDFEAAEKAYTEKYASSIVSDAKVLEKVG